MPEARPFTKIRLQRPAGSSHDHRRRSASPAAAAATVPVKLEPLDEDPQSPSEPVYHEDGRDDEDSGASNTPNLESILAMQEEDDPGDDMELADAGSELGTPRCALFIEPFYRRSLASADMSLFFFLSFSDKPI